ncbi:MAG: right-handed parallel beta-helix repeat-containing protein [Candidatus Krumholzibacteriota bacterium]
MKLLARIVPTTIAMTLLATLAQAATLAVPADYPTLAAALEMAGSGDEIQLAPGFYLESGLVAPAGVTITGTGTKPQDVVLNGNGEDRILLVESAVEAVTIRNITFMSGMAAGETSYDQSGGALFISNSNARIENCVFSANSADSHGGAIRCSHSSPEIISCQFYANSAPNGGGGALDLSYDSSPVVTDCYFLANKAEWGGAMSCRGGSSPRVENSELMGNTADGLHGYGGGVFADNLSYPDLLQTTVADNEARFGGGLASFSEGPINLDYCTVANNKAGVLEGGMLVVDSSPLITGTILAFNEGRGVSVAGALLPQITCTDIYGNSAGDWAIKLGEMKSRDGNVSVDPQFCSSMVSNSDRFNLKTSSPLVDPGSPCGTLGANPVTCTGEKTLDEVPVAAAGIGRVVAAPNPFNPQTVISFELAAAQDVRVSIYGIDGRLVQVLGEGMFHSGAHELVWTGRDRSGRSVSSGIYFVLVKGRRDTQRLKVTLLK